MVSPLQLPSVPQNLETILSSHDGTRRSELDVAHSAGLPRRRRVLHVMTTFSVSSGAAENARLTVNLLPRDRFEVFLAVPPGQTMEARVARHVIVLPLPTLGRPVRPWLDIAAFIALYRLCKKWRFDVVHTHNSKDGVLGRWAAHFAGVPVIVHTIHNLPFRASRHGFVNWWYAVIERWTARITDAILAVSTENVGAYLTHRIGTKSQYRVVYSGLELDRYRAALSQAEARARLGLPEATAVVGWFGRFNYQKDPFTFIRAARIVADEFPGVRFVVCGDDPLGEDLALPVRDLAQQLGIAERMHFLGFRADLPLVLRALDVVMHSSRYEGMGRTVCEALLCGRPVAGTAVDGMREVIVSGVRGGILVPPGEPPTLANATLTLLRDPERARALAAAGGAWVEANLSAADMVRGIVDTYVRALEISQRSEGHRLMDRIPQH
jgi:glycosyltransferase involved in cell wall biosynthesis